MIQGRTAGSVLLLGNYRPALTLARGLHAKGFRVIAGTLGCEGGCEHSRAVAQMWDHPDPSTEPERFLAALSAFCASRTDLVAIYPVSEDMVRFFASDQAPADLQVPVAMVPPAIANRCFDKLAMLDLAAQNTVPAAAYARATSHKDIEEIAARIGYPVVIRPLNSERRIGRKKALTVASETELAVWKPELLEHDELLVQRRFEGTRHNLYFAALGGQVVRGLHARILRTDRLDGSGLALEGTTLPVEGEIMNQTRRLVGALGYDGIGCAQFLVDPVSGESSFLEINPRIAGNHALPEATGLELGPFLLDLARGRTPNLTPRYAPAGIRYCWTSGDILAAKETYMRGEIGAMSALGWMAGALLTALRSPIHMVFEWRDPLPALHALVSLLPRLDRSEPRQTSAEAASAAAKGVKL